ncbi:hypothetical protein [Pseudovibrio sp. Tun.PSC04-5.I4]|uniref:hypothetical protein n=1 Tax=Pseudovibrio sp. Tun.PSC04-5.I4 TaxID=1798213 RepID=UPI0013566E55|nr:hypothetical protein [Pseudovibrio sp. Tun.PSC04-5.I4]
MGWVPDLESQEMLQESGFDPEGLDGDWGKLPEGAFHNPSIIDWAKKLGIGYGADETP